MRILIIGGGLFGSSAAIELSKNQSFKIDIVEQESDIMMKASRCNHNRLHLGYHYLRSIPTAIQSIEGLLSFMFSYGDAAIYQFPNYYAIAKEGSKTSAKEFTNFCDQVGIGYDEEYPDDFIMDKDKIEVSFKVPEPIFDYDILKSIIKKRLNSAKNVSLQLNSKCTKVEKSGKLFVAQINDKEFEYDVVVNVTYNNINVFNKFLELPLDNLLFEEVIIPFFLYPAERFGLTIMDGEFCSVMPKGGNKNEFLLYHVKHSVIQDSISKFNSLQLTESIEDVVQTIYDESKHFYPFLKNVKHFDYWRTIRTVHENKEDARVTELFTYEDLDNYYTILSGKIPTCMQVALHLRRILEGKATKQRFRI